jgi:hypothetical protein
LASLLQQPDEVAVVRQQQTIEVVAFQNRGRKATGLPFLVTTIADSRVASM